MIEARLPTGGALIPELPMDLVLPHFPVLSKGDRVRLSEDGCRVHGADPAREGTIVRLVRQRRHAYVRWDGLTSVAMILDIYLQRVSL